jgi:hypothetical protein
MTRPTPNARRTAGTIATTTLGRPTPFMGLQFGAVSRRRFIRTSARGTVNSGLRNNSPRTDRVWCGRFRLSGLTAPDAAERGIYGFLLRTWGVVSPLPSTQRPASPVSEFVCVGGLLPLRRLRLRLGSRDKDACPSGHHATADQGVLTLERSLPALCAQCLQPVTIAYELNGDRGGRYRLQRWNCPVCQRQNSLNLSGRIVGVATRQSGPTC